MAIDGGAGSVSFLNEYRNELEITRNDEQMILARYGGSVRVIACIENQDVIDRILAHLRETEKAAYPIATTATRPNQPTVATGHHGRTAVASGCQEAA